MTGSRVFFSYESLLELHYVPYPRNNVIWLMEKDNSEHKTVAYFSPLASLTSTLSFQIKQYKKNNITNIFWKATC